MPQPESSVQPRDRSHPWSRFDFILLAVVLCVALALRWWKSDDTPPSMDEQWHLALSTGRGTPFGTFPVDQLVLRPAALTSLEGAPSIARVWTSLDGVLHPPLYMVTLRLWREIAGGSDPAGHALSAAFGVAALVFVFAGARLSFGRTVAFWAALILAVAPTQIYLSLEIRGYAMLLALGSATLYALASIDVYGVTTRRMAVLAGLVLALMLTHYFALGACFAVLVYGLARFGRQNRARWVGLLAASAVVYLLIWGPFMAEQMNDIRRTGDSWLIVPGQNPLVSLGRFAALPVRLVAEVEIDRHPWTLFSVILYVLAGVIAWRRRPGMRPWLWWLLGVAGFLLALDLCRHTKHLAFIRYATLAGPASAVLIVAAAEALDRRLASLVSLAALLAGGMFWQARFDGDSPDFSGLARALLDASSPGEPLLFCPGQADLWLAESGLLAALHDSTLRDRPMALLTRPMRPEMRDQLAGRTAWLVWNRPDRPSVSELIPDVGVTQAHALPPIGVIARLSFPPRSSSKPSAATGGN